MNTFKKPLKIVIADDDAVTSGALRILLNEHGCQVIGEARDGERAVELCQTHRPDIAFLDIQMPRLDGHQAAERIRECAPDTGTILITSVPTMENVQRALQSGITGFVVKPFSAIKVVDAIRSCLRQKEARTA